MKLLDKTQMKSIEGLMTGIFVGIGLMILVGVYLYSSMISTDEIRLLISVGFALIFVPALFAARTLSKVQKTVFVEAT